MADNCLGRLESVPIRDCWAHEAHDFTPWLAQEDNLNELGRSLGLHLVFEAKEVAVGRYSLDLLCRDQGDSDLVVIENQFGFSDHKHLGQILTYASGLSATKIIWIAEGFKPEHRKAIQRLNDSTDDGTCFFCVKIQAVRIGDSLPAARFDLMESPRDWVSHLEGRRVLSQSQEEKEELRRTFWEAYDKFEVDGLASLNSKRTMTGERRFSAMGRDAHLVVSLADGLIGLELKLENETGKYLFEGLRSERDKIQDESRFDLDWKENKKSWLVTCSDGWKLSDQAKWEAALIWLQQAIEVYRTVFSGRLEKLYRGVDKI